MVTRSKPRRKAGTTTSQRAATKPGAATGKAATKPGAAKRTTATKPGAAKGTTATKPGAAKGTTAEGKLPRVFAMSFASVYPLYVQKAEKKGRTRAEVDEVIGWLTGYRGAALRKVIDDKADFTAFFAGAPRWNPDARLITGLVCGVRVEEVADPLMQKIRYLDKLVDELARGKSMASVLRER